MNLDMGKLISDNEDVMDHLENSMLLRAGAVEFSKLFPSLSEEDQHFARMSFCAGALYVVKTIMMNDDVIGRARNSLMAEMEEMANARRA